MFNVRASFSKITDSYYTPETIIGEEGLDRLWPGNKWYASHIRDIPEIYFPRDRCPCRHAGALWAIRLLVPRAAHLELGRQASQECGPPLCQDRPPVPRSAGRCRGGRAECSSASGRTRRPDTIFRPNTGEGGACLGLYDARRPQHRSRAHRAHEPSPPRRIRFLPA